MAETPRTASKKRRAAASIFILRSASLNMPLFQLSRKNDLMTPPFWLTFLEF